MLFWVNKKKVLKTGSGKFVRFGQEFDESVMSKTVLKGLKKEGSVSDVNPNAAKPAPKEKGKKGK